MFKKIIKKMFIASLSKTEKTHLIMCARRLEYPGLDGVTISQNIHDFILPEQTEIALDAMIDYLYLDRCIH